MYRLALSRTVRRNGEGHSCEEDPCCEEGQCSENDACEGGTCWGDAKNGNRQLRLPVCFWIILESWLKPVCSAIYLLRQRPSNRVSQKMSLYREPFQTVPFQIALFQLAPIILHLSYNPLQIALPYIPSSNLKPIRNVSTSKHLLISRLLF